MATYYDQACQQAQNQCKALEEQVEARHKILEDSCKDVVESVGEHANTESTQSPQGESCSGPTMSTGGTTGGEAGQAGGEEPPKRKAARARPTLFDLVET